MSLFDPETFLNATTTEANDTTLTPIPPGEYSAQIEAIQLREVIDKNGNPRQCLDVTYNILDENIKDELGRDRLTVRQTVWLDITDQGQLDTSRGKNIGLGRLRAATNLNQPGKPFSMSQLIGQTVLVITGLRPDRNDPTILYTDVRSVGALPR